MKNNIDSISSNTNTLAHELVAREEQNVAMFFISFAIQIYVTKEILKRNLKEPTFILYYGDMEIFASQRVLIKNIILNKDYQKCCIEIEKILMESNSSGKLPHEIFLSKINKSFLIRQIFNQTDQVLAKYKFIDQFMNLDIAKLNLSDLWNNMTDLTVEEQILILSRIFSQIKDSFENKKKSIGLSFLENLDRTKLKYTYYKSPSCQELININMLIGIIKNY